MSVLSSSGFHKCFRSTVQQILLSLLGPDYRKMKKSIGNALFLSQSKRLWLKVMTQASVFNTMGCVPTDACIANLLTAGSIHSDSWKGRGRVA